MGFKDFIKDITPDCVEDAVEEGTEWLGDRVEDAGNWTADRLEDAGWDSGADWVREQSRSLANRMGAETDEMDLGQTEDKTKLVYGSPSKIRATASRLRHMHTAFDDVGKGLQGLDSAHLRGRTADAFRESVSVEPPKWFKGADAFEKAAGALDSFAGTVEWAQGQAQAAVEKWKAGLKASQEAREAHREKVEAYNKAAEHYNAQPADRRDPSSLPPKPGEFTDPGAARMKEAQEILAEARRQRNAAAETARAAVRAARDAAPPKPSYGEQAMDGVREVPVMVDHFEGGALKGTAGLLNFVRSVNPTDPYNITHPAEYLTSLNSTATGLLRVANDPWGAGGRMISDFAKDPSEGLGRLAPDVLLTAATGGAGAGVKAARVAKEGTELAADARRARGLLDRAPEGTYDRPGRERVTKGTDPVDLASGRMFLPQTDVALDGDLPLVFTRRVESGYTAGRFFGPSWSSTVDERLEIDAAGVVHVTTDGLLLAYPHPVPGLPTLPLTGTCRRTLARDAAGDYAVTDPDTGLVRHFPGPAGTRPGGDGVAWLAETADLNGNRITVDRAADGTPLALVHSAGHRLTVGVAAGRITALALAGAGENGTDRTLMSYGYHAGDLTTVTKPSGATLTFTYDERHRVTSWTDSNGSRYRYAYDAWDRTVAEGGEAGHLTLTLAYGDPDPATGHRVTTLTTADGHTTRHLIGAGCRVLATTDPLGHTTRFTYDPRGNLLTHTDPLDRTATYTYDDHGRLTTVTRPDGSASHVERDEAGRITRLTEPDGATWHQEHDARGNRTALTDPAGHTTRYTYDASGRLTSVTDPLGAVTTVRCDASGLPLVVTDPLGGTTRYDRDAWGRPVRITDPLGAVTTLTWTVDGDLARRTAPDGTSESWTYDGEGNRTSHTDAAGHTTRFEYTHFDLLAARTDPDGARYAFTHDARLRLTRVTNPQGLTWTYTYDEADRLIAETDFDGRTTGYAHDAAGQLTARVTPLGESVRYAYDVLGRPVRKDAEGRLTTYAYDAADRLVRATGPDGELLRRYDRCGRLKTELSDGRATTYAYDAAGRRTRRTTPAGHVTTYAHDAAGRARELSAGGRRITFAHDAAGRETHRAVADTLTVTSTWDATGRLTTQHLAAGGRTLNHRAYTYRPDGCLTALEDALRGSTRFTLDATGRVTDVTAENWHERYAYDAAGNQTRATWPARHPDTTATGPRTYTGTTVTRAGRVRYDHDAAGRMVLRRKHRLSRKPDTWRYEWDPEDRLTAVTTPDGTRWRYRYDPLGRRTAKQRLAEDGHTVREETRFTWDGTTLCEQTATSPALPHPVALTWDHRGLHPLAQTERLLDDQQAVDERFFAITTDLLGTPTELVDASGTLAWHSRTTLWGTTTWPTTSTTYTPLRFPGQYHDPETGLHYNLHRHYDPETARYLTPDPLGLTPAPNPATYVHNPHICADPLGLMPYDRKDRVGGGRLAQESGDAYEADLQQQLGGGGGFKEGKRQFDGAFVDSATGRGTWYEAKSGRFWEDTLADPKRLEKFKGVEGEKVALARERGIDYRIISENPIPPEFTSWFEKKGIPWQVIPRSRPHTP